MYSSVSSGGGRFSLRCWIFIFLYGSWCKMLLEEKPSATDSCSKDPDLACMCICFGSERQKVHAESKTGCLSSMVIREGMVLLKICQLCVPDEGERLQTDPRQMISRAALFRHDQIKDRKRHRSAPARSSHMPAALMCSHYQPVSR